MLGTVRVWAILRNRRKRCDPSVVSSLCAAKWRGLRCTHERPVHALRRATSTSSTTPPRTRTIAVYTTPLLRIAAAAMRASGHPRALPRGCFAHSRIKLPLCAPC